MVLYALMALVAGFETYPGGVSKPWGVIIVTVGLAIFKFLVVHRLHYLARDPVSPDSAVRTYLVVHGLGAVFFKFLELTLIAFLVPKSKIITPVDVWNFCGPICVEVLSATLMFLGNCRTDKIFLGQKGELFERFSSPEFAASLCNREKSMLLKALVVGACSAPSPSFNQY